MSKLEDFRLRGLEERDLAKVLEWRNSDRIRACMFSDNPISADEHRAWFERTRNTTESVYLVFERREKPLGLVYFVDIDRKNSKSHWGFYVGEEAQPAGTGSALGYFGLHHGFEELRLRKIIGEVLCSNPRSIAFHKKLGFVEEGHFKTHVLKNGSYEDVLSLALFADDWRKNQHRLRQLIFPQEDSACDP